MSEVIFASHNAILEISIIQVFVINAQIIAKNVGEFQAPALDVIIPSFCIIVLALVHAHLISTQSHQAKYVNYAILTVYTVQILMKIRALNVLIPTIY
jgi:hypothetical protein